MLPFAPEELDAMRERYPRAVIAVFDHQRLGDKRPGESRVHVFDFQDGLRLLISRERATDGRTGVHFSASIQGRTTLYRKLKKRGFGPTAFCDDVVQRWQSMSGSTRMPELLGLSEGKGVPHFIVWDAN